MTIDKKTDEQLMRFLKENQPETPEPKPDEERQVLAAIEKRSARKGLFQFPHLWKWAVPGLATAAVLLALFFLQNPVKDSGTKTANNAELEEFLHQTVGAVYEGNGIYSGVGEEWLTLAEQVAY